MNGEEWIELLAPLDHWNERLLLGVFGIYGIPSNYLDLGSGTGAMVNVARRLGVEAFGIDQIERPDEWLLQHDLREPLDLGREFEMVSCIEVAEHMPPESAEILAKTIARHVKPGGMLLWSSASPGQAGDGHINPQPATYWRSLLWEAGKLNWREERGYRLSLVWSLVRSPMNWLPANVQVFNKINPSEIYPREAGGY